MRFGITAILASLLLPTTFDAPTHAAEEAQPAIARTGDWRTAVRQFAEPTGPDAVARLEKQLREVPPRILSKAGKARTAQRVRELEDFLKTLRGQTSDLGSL